MNQSVMSWARRLRERAESQASSNVAALEALELVDQEVAKMVDGHDSVEAKVQIRQKLGQFRRSFADATGPATPELRHHYEKLRNLTLDNTVERLEKGGRGYPGATFVVAPPATDIPNFQVVDETFLRGGQPDQDGLTWLAEHGVKTRVDLRGDDKHNQWNPPAWNPKSIKTFEIGVRDFEAPSLEMVEQFLEIVDAPENQPVFVHCKAGIGRTGVMTACRNISHGMTADQALALESINSYHGNLKQEAFVREFETYWKSKNPRPKAPEKARVHTPC